MRLIVRPLRKRNQSQDDIDDFDAAIAADPRVRVVAWEGALPRAAFLGASALFKVGGGAGMRAVPVLPKSRLLRLDRAYFAVLMGPTFAKVMPQFMLPATKGVYLFDVWPSTRDRVVEFVERFRVDHVFISASQSADYVRERVRGAVHWLPEGTDPTPYRSRPLAERDVDVLQMGRKYEAYHERIVGPLAAAGRTYRYERVKGQLIFPTKDDLIEGLARSKVSVCVPSNITHPERAGDVETMTMRYLQSMASRCLVVGHAPAEMVRLFGYNPVVEIDMADPAGQLLDVLAHMDRYAGLIERNHRAVHDGHTWHHRWARIAEVMLG